MGNPNNAKSGHENIIITKAGKRGVIVAGVNLGTFPNDEEAIKARDEYRAKHNMRKART